MTRYKGQNNTQHRLNVYIWDCKEDMTAISSYVCLKCVLGALCYVCVPKIDELTIWTFQLELGEFGPELEPLQFVSGRGGSRIWEGGVQCSSEKWHWGATHNYLWKHHQERAKNNNFIRDKKKICQLETDSFICDMTKHQSWESFSKFPLLRSSNSQKSTLSFFFLIWLNHSYSTFLQIIPYLMRYAQSCLTIFALQMQMG